MGLFQVQGVDRKSYTTEAIFFATSSAITQQNWQEPDRRDFVEIGMGLVDSRGAFRTARKAPLTWRLRAENRIHCGETAEISSVGGCKSNSSK
ncbi:MAG: hypothetical protein AAF745_02335 [Planctomycetota bacterium]